MLPKIIGIIFGILAVGIFAWKFKETPLCRPWTMLPLGFGVGYAAYWVVNRMGWWVSIFWIDMTDQTTAAFTALQKSKFQPRFKLSNKDRQYIHSNGIDTIRSHAIDFITTRLAPALPKNEGKQTPMKGPPAFISQHATATCCRGCLWKRHRIEKGRPLTEDEIGYVVELVMGWIRHSPHYSPHS